MKSDDSDKPDRMEQTAQPNRSDRADDRRSDSALRPHCGYRKLRSFQVTQVIYDGVVSFCNRFVDKRSRTHDQMVQAARSGRQNISDDPAIPYARWLNNPDPEIVANALICLIHQANYLLDRQLEGLERQFASEGGFSEKLAALRRNAKLNYTSDQSDPTDKTDRTDPTENAPVCPSCGKVMILRTARQGRNAGSKFWGCTAYPECRETRQIEKLGDCGKA